MDTADRNYVESLIERASNAALTASEVAELHGLTATVEQLGFALYFLRVATAKLPDRRKDRT